MCGIIDFVHMHLNYSNITNPIRFWTSLCLTNFEPLLVLNFKISKISCYQFYFLDLTLKISRFLKQWNWWFFKKHLRTAQHLCLVFHPPWAFNLHIKHNFTNHNFPSNLNNVYFRNFSNFNNLLMTWLSSK